MKKQITMGIFAMLSGLFPCQANADTNVVCSDEGFQTTLDIDNFKWTRQPESCVIKGDTIEVVTKPCTDLWQRTYYHFRNENAPVLQMATEKKTSSLIIKTD